MFTRLMNGVFNALRFGIRGKKDATALPKSKFRQDIQGLRGAVFALVLLLATVSVMPTTASASNATRYSAFGNLTNGDCSFAAAANLVRMHWPSAPITAAQVLLAYRTSGVDGLTYLQGPGFGGHHINEPTSIANQPAQIIAAVATGGVFADVMQGTHAVAVVGATARTVSYVTWGDLITVSWAKWATVGVVYLWSVTWPAANTQTVSFKGSYETSTMVPETYPTGTVAPLSPLGFVNDGYTFLGWNTRANGSGTMYANGATYHFTQSAILYAIWSYTGAPATTTTSP
jgi:hypothetical protein